MSIRAIHLHFPQDPFAEGPDLRDVATVSDGFAPQTNVVRQDGRRGVLVTVLALTYASLLEGAVLTETVFAWPGLGRYLTTALFAGDTPAILGGTLVIGFCFVLVNRAADLLARLLDPRIR